MRYLEYEDLKKKYLKAQEIYDSILSEKEQIFQRTQPKSTMGEYEREHDKLYSVGGKGGNKVNQIEEYVILLDQNQVNERLAEAKSILDDRERLMLQKERDLRRSKNIDDELYTMRYLDRMRISTISRLLCYSESQIYRRLKTIRAKVKDARKCEI